LNVLHLVVVLVVSLWLVIIVVASIFMVDAFSLVVKLRIDVWLVVIRFWFWERLVIVVVIAFVVRLASCLELARGLVQPMLVVTASTVMNCFRLAVLELGMRKLDGQVIGLCVLLENVGNAHKRKGCTKALRTSVSVVEYSYSHSSWSSSCSCWRLSAPGASASVTSSTAAAMFVKECCRVVAEMGTSK
jgi:hypothetical protein